MLFSMWLVLSMLLYSLQLSTGSFPKPLTEEEERHYVLLAQQGTAEDQDISAEEALDIILGGAV